jgi:regulator of protease activity HflC (stomatin/prohibitin superfamily)
MGNCCICVSPDELAAVERCGSFQGIRGAGCHCIGFDVGGTIMQTRKVSTRVQEYNMTTETKTKDNVFVRVMIAVQVEIVAEKAYEAIYRLTNPASQIDSYVSDVVRGQVPVMKLDDLFESKDEIAGAVKERLSKCMGEYGYTIHQCLVTDLRPDEKVRSAMNEIDANRRLRVAAAERAEADKVLKVKAAEAEAESKFLQGQGVARQRTAIVEGLKHAVGGSTEMDPKTVQELLLITQYFDTLERLANGQATTVFMPHTVGNLANISDDIRNGTMQANAPRQQTAMRK